MPILIDSLRGGQLGKTDGQIYLIRSVLHNRRVVFVVVVVLSRGRAPLVLSLTELLTILFPLYFLLVLSGWPGIGDGPGDLPDMIFSFGYQWN